MLESLGFIEDLSVKYKRKSLNIAFLDIDGSYIS
jgi:hypothetical protein